MSKMEIIIVVGLCIVPFLAILIVFPIKFKKKSKKVEVKQPVKEETPSQKVEESVEIKHNSTDLEDFVNFAKNRKSNLNGSKSIKQPSVTSFDPRQFIKPAPKPKNVKQEIKELTPEVKTLILTGALAEPKYKDFDKF